MNKRIKELIKKLKELFLKEIIEKTARKTKFMQRKGKLTPEAFVSLCVFDNNDLSTNSLSNLCARLISSNNISMSEEALNERFNRHSVDFLKEIFNLMLKKQNQILDKKHKSLKTHFNRIKITDSTSFILPEEYKTQYKGNGGNRSNSSVKIQLEYELLTGQFLHCEVLDGTKSDSEYLEKLQEDICENDLCLKDLGYFKIDDLELISEKAFFISKLKSSANVYVKNKDVEKHKNGKVVKSKEYTKVDIEKTVESLAEDQTIEIPIIYIGKNKKLKSRLIITKLTKENKRKKESKHKKEVERGRARDNKRTELWANINAYITNVPTEILNKEEVHDIYSLRWQIELMFKIWKSTFKIHRVKKVKLHRFECHLYGKLISLLLTSSLVFTAKSIICEQENKAISEMKSFGIVREFFPNLKEKIFKGEVAIANIIDGMLDSILKHCIKSKKKGKKASFLILDGIKIKASELEVLTA